MATCIVNFLTQGSFGNFLGTKINGNEKKFRSMTSDTAPNTSASNFRRLLIVVISNFLLFSNVSLANQSHNDQSRKDQLDLREQREIDSIKEIKSPRILLAIPFREYLVSPTEDDFRRDACKYDLREKDIEADLMAAIKKSHPLAYKKSLGWTNAIVGIDYFDSKENAHAILFEQDYPGYARINGYFDGHPITADSSFVQNIYRIVLSVQSHNPCDSFIESYLK